jgi:hypothetical protein
MNSAKEIIHLSDWPIFGRSFDGFVVKTLQPKRRLLAFKFAIFTSCMDIFATISNTSLRELEYSKSRAA